MGTRGRKSANELAAARIGPSGVMRTRRLDPPAGLGEEATRLWRTIVNSLPADGLHPGAAPVLTAYCSLSVSLRRTLGYLERLETNADGFDVAEWRELQRQAAALGQRVAMLATKLRLTPQSMVHRETAGRRVRDAARVSAYDLWDANAES